MKKIFSTLALAACALVASAQLIPTGFNYQGRTSEPDKTVATFNVLNAAGETVYSQTETLNVTANGTFTVVIGNEADEAWNTINWGEGGYTINTVINDVVVSSAKLQYVPYAAYATSVAGMDELQNDVADLVKANHDNQTDIAELKLDVATAGTRGNEAYNVAATTYELVMDTFANIDENMSMSNEIIDTLLEGQDSLTEAVELLYNENDGPIAALNDGFTMLNNLVSDQAEDITALKEGLDVVSNDLADIVAANRVNMTDIAQLKEDLAGIDQFTDELNRDYADAMADLREELVGIEQNFELLFSEDDGPIASLTQGFTMLSNVVSDQAADITALQEGLDTTQGDLVELVPVIKGLQAHAAEQDLINENIEAAIPLVQQNVEDIDALQAGLDVVENDLADIVAANRVNMTDIAQLKEDVAAIDQFTDELNRDYAASMNELREILVELEKVDENVTSDVQGLMEMMRGVVTIDQFNADMANIDENVSKFNEIIDVLLEQKDANDEAIANISSDLQGLQEKMRGVATVDALNEVEATLMNVAENANLAAQTAQAAYDKASDFEDAINYISSDLQGVQEVLRGKADIQDYTSMKEAIDELRRQIANNAAAIAGLTALINR